VWVLVLWGLGWVGFGGGGGGVCGGGVLGGGGVDMGDWLFFWLWGLLVGGGSGVLGRGLGGCFCGVGDTQPQTPPAVRLT